MAYNETYTASDASTAIIDLGVTAIAAMVAFGSIIGLVLVYRWLKGRKTL